MHQHIIQSSLLQGVVPDRIVEGCPFVAPDVGTEPGVAVGAPGDNRTAAALGLSTAHISPLHLKTRYIKNAGGVTVLHVDGALCTCVMGKCLVHP